MELQGQYCRSKIYKPIHPYKVNYPKTITNDKAVEAKYWSKGKDFFWRTELEYEGRIEDFSHRKGSNNL